MGKVIFSFNQKDEKVEVVEATRGSFDVMYFHEGEKLPVVVNTSSLPSAMELVRSFVDETATEH